MGRFRFALRFRLRVFTRTGLRGNDQVRSRRTAWPTNGSPMPCLAAPRACVAKTAAPVGKQVTRWHAETRSTNDSESTPFITSAAEILSGAFPVLAVSALSGGCGARPVGAEPILQSVDDGWTQVAGPPAGFFL
jgi:hypothetical protein